MNERDDANVGEPAPIRVATREEFDAAVGELFRTGRPIKAPSLKALDDWDVDLEDDEGGISVLSIPIRDFHHGLLVYIKKTAELVRTTALGDKWVSCASTGRKRTEEGGSKGALEDPKKRTGWNGEDRPPGP